MKFTRLSAISASILAVSALPLIQTGCSKQPAAAPTTAATPAPAAPAAPVPAAPAAPAPAAPAAPAAGINFGDMSSVTLTGKAWKASEEKNYDEAIVYAQKCIDTFKKQAVDQQKALTAPPTEKEAVFAQWALNDVGTSYFILGQAYEKQNKPKEAIAAYQTLVDDLPFAQCWDPKGWFWNVAGAAKTRVKALGLDTLK